MEAKIQILTGNELRYVNLSEFISLVSSNLNQVNLANEAQRTNETTFYNIDDLTKLFRVSRPTIHAWIDKSLLKPIKLGGRVYFSYSDIVELMESKKTA